MPDIQKQPEHVNHVEKSIREHVPAPGDIYVSDPLPSKDREHP